MKDILVSPLIDDFVEQADRKRDSIEVSAGNKKIQFAHQGRIFGFCAPIRGLVHAIERFE